MVFNYKANRFCIRNQMYLYGKSFTSISSNWPASRLSSLSTALIPINYSLRRRCWLLSFWSWSFGRRRCRSWSYVCRRVTVRSSSSTGREWRIPLHDIFSAASLYTAPNGLFCRSSSANLRHALFFVLLERMFCQGQLVIQVISVLLNSVATKPTYTLFLTLECQHKTLSESSTTSRKFSFRRISNYSGH